jgi:hypothetical protein
VRQAEKPFSRNGALWNAVPRNGPPRVNPGRIQGCSNRPLSPRACVKTQSKLIAANYLVSLRRGISVK